MGVLVAKLEDRLQNSVDQLAAPCKTTSAATPLPGPRLCVPLQQPVLSRRKNAGIDCDLYRAWAS